MFLLQVLLDFVRVLGEFICSHRLRAWLLNAWQRKRADCLLVFTCTWQVDYSGVVDVVEVDHISSN